jgi:excisionase family DNA binding protein
MNSATTLSGRALYTVPEAMEMLNLSRTVIYEQIRSGRLLTVTQGRRRLVPASSMTAYIDLLPRDRSDGSCECPHVVAEARARFIGTNRGSGGWRPSMSDSAPRASGNGSG